MKWLIIWLPLLALVVACKPRASLLVVDKNGDGITSLEEAISQAMELKKEDPSVLINIDVKPGEYHLKSAIQISPELNGLKIQGAGADKVSILGSVPLKLKWNAYNDHILVANVAEGLEFDQFLIDGKAQIMARYPNYDENAHYWNGYAADAISKEKVAGWANPEGAYFHALHSGRWGGFHWRVTGVNKDGSLILEGGHQNNRGSRPHKDFRFIENVFEELDSPGEWYLNTDDNKLFYWPAEGVDLKSASFEAAVLKDLIQVVGTLERPVKDITISGIKF